MDAVIEAELLLAEEISTEQENELVRVFRAAGLRPRVRRPLVHRGSAELGWLVLVALPLHAFLSGLSTEVVKDLYLSVKGMVGRKINGESGSHPEPAPLVLQDSTGLKIVLEADLPASAYEALATLDLAEFRIGPLHYDRQCRAWRSELDEAAS